MVTRFHVQLSPGVIGDHSGARPRPPEDQAEKEADHERHNQSENEVPKDHRCLLSEKSVQLSVIQDSCQDLRAGDGARIHADASFEEKGGRPVEAGRQEGNRFALAKLAWQLHSG
jgi:hypothetical protein